MLYKRYQPNIIGWVPYLDRVILLKLRGQYFNIKIMQTYVLTCDGDDEAVDAFYEQIAKALNDTKHFDITIIIGDINAKGSR